MSDYFVNDNEPIKPLTTKKEGTNIVQDIWNSTKAVNKAVQFFELKNSIENQKQGLDPTRISSKEMFDGLSKESDYVKNAIIDSPVKTKGEFYSRIDYYRKQEENQKQIQANQGGFTQIVTSIPGMLFDVDAVPIFKGYKAIEKITEGAGLMTRVGTQSLYGGATNVAYEASNRQMTGKTDEHSYKNDFLIGTLFTGGLSLVSEGASTFKPKTNLFIKDKNKAVTEQEALLHEQTVVQGNLNKIDEALSINRNINSSISHLTEDLKVAKTNDKTLFNKVKDGFNNTVTDASNRVKEIKATIKETTTKVKEFTAKQTELVDKYKKDSLAYEAAITEHTNKASVLDKDIKSHTADFEQFTEIKNVINDIKQQISSFKESNQVTGSNYKILTKQVPEGTPNRNTMMLEMSNSLAKNDKKIAELTKQVKDLEKYKNQLWGKDKAENLKALNKERMTVEDTINSLTEAYTPIKEQHLTDINTNWEVLQQTKKSIPELSFIEQLHKRVGSEAKKELKDLPKTKELTSYHTTKLLDKINKAKAHLEPENFTSLLNERGLLEGRLEKFKNGTATIDDLKEIRKIEQNKLEEIGIDLKTKSDSIKTLDDLAANYQAIPSFMKNILISPIAKLWASDNMAVVGFASKLRQSTLNMGLISNYNAASIKSILDSKVTQYETALYNGLREYRQKVNPGITEVEYKQLVMDETYNVLYGMQNRAMEGIDAALPHKEQISKYKENLSSQSKVFSEGIDSNIQKNVKNILEDYFEYMHQRGNKAGLSGFIESSSKGYIPRMWEKAKIEAYGRDKAIKLLYEAQINKYRRFNGVETEAIHNEFKDIATSTVDNVLDGTKDLDRTVSLIERGQPNPSSLKERTIDVFDKDVQALITDDIDAIIGKYQFKVHGRIALKEGTGLSNLGEAEAFINKIPNITSKEKDNLAVVIQDILGTREVTKNPFALQARVIKGLSSVSTATTMLGFGITSVMDLAQVYSKFGSEKIMKYTFKDIGNLHELYKTGTASDKNIISLVGSIGEAFFGHRAIRMDIEGGIDSTGKIQHFLDKATGKAAVYGGLQPVTDVMRLITTSATVDFIGRMSVKKNLSAVETKMLNGMGVDTNKLAQFRKVMDVADDGTIRNYNINTWGELNEEMQRISWITQQETVLHPSASTLPKFMTDYDGGGLVPRILAKFTRFPVASYESMLLRNIQEANANKLTGLAVNYALASLILMARDSVKPEEKQRFSLEDEEKRNDLWKAAGLFTNSIALPVLAYDTAAQLTGHQTAEGYKGVYQPAPLKVFNDMAREGKIKVSAPVGSVGFNATKGTVTLFNQEFNLYEAVKDMEE